MPIDASIAVRINHSVFLDVAHTANPGKFVPAGVDPTKLPDADSEINQRTDMLDGQSIRGVRVVGAPIEGQETYDDELLGMHFICGDGRCNENIALTGIHHIWHSEHDRLADVAKCAILDTGRSRHQRVDQPRRAAERGLPRPLRGLLLRDQQREPREPDCDP